RRGVRGRWRSWAPRLRSLLRSVAAFMFILAGTTKLFAFPAGVPPNDPWMSEMGLGGALEVFGGGLVLLGLFTRPVAFLLSGEMAFAYFIGHAPHGFWTVLNQGAPAVVYCFLFLYFSAAGAGPWSLDALLAGRRMRAAQACGY